MDERQRWTLDMGGGNGECELMVAMNVTMAMVLAMAMAVVATGQVHALSRTAGQGVADRDTEGQWVGGVRGRLGDTCC